MKTAIVLALGILIAGMIVYGVLLYRDAPWDEAGDESAD